MHNLPAIILFTSLIWFTIGIIINMAFDDEISSLYIKYTSELKSTLTDGIIQCCFFSLSFGPTAMFIISIFVILWVCINILTYIVNKLCSFKIITKIFRVIPKAITILDNIIFKVESKFKQE